ncbi:hypothetical protein [Fimbriiglobus ruber]|uniref:Uncharacterized protein n=1 Tax=Fimbriiglobus ruber TaxID=1908690 RepID=A0A225D9A4_9BACT|nr:hypothetical protein [Fimbriiglobus ruber]OWK37553.1 hypothetical protein FRUB_06673 [Fimbriiglobus ruber]
MGNSDNNALARAGLELIAPDRIRKADREIVVGPVGFALLAALSPGAVGVAAAKVSLWTDAAAPDNRLKRAVFRVNTKLRALAIIPRVRFDDGKLVLL